MKTYEVAEVKLHAFLTSALNEVELPLSAPAALHSRKETLVPIG
jgi:hypothetical protein